jgi:hypothetical protein
MCDKAASAASCRILWRAIRANILASPHNVAGISRKETELMQPFVRRFSLFATLLLSLAAVASAQDGRTCSLAGVAGQWGWTATGTLYQPTGPAEVARVGTTTADAEGNFSATLTASTGGRVSQLAMKGTWTVNPDCTVTMTLSVYDASGNLAATQTWNIVFDDNERELRAILTSVVLGGTSVPAVVTMTGRRVSRGRPGRS